jgi:dTDP-4-dehydrorhamnose 3,5-epimerase-like enzyme
MLKTVKDIEEVVLPHNVRSDGDLVVAQQGKELSFAPARLFTVRGIEGAVRGCHAHKRCIQFLICVHGAIEVECDDGRDRRRIILDRGNKGLLIPPSIWGTETYRTDGAVLAVLCDRLYEEDDYIRDYDQFLTWRRSGL